MKYIYRIFVFLTVVLLLGALGLTFIFAPRGQKLANENKIKNKDQVQEPEKISIFDEDEDIVNILLVGIDSSEVTYERIPRGQTPLWSYQLIQNTTGLDSYPYLEIHTTS